MAQPTAAQYANVNSTSAGLVAQNINERMLTILASLATGTNPDGTNATTPETGFASTDLIVGASVAAAANNQTLTGAAGVFTYLAGFMVGGLGATGASNIQITLTGVPGAAGFLWVVGVPAGATVPVTVSGVAGVATAGASGPGPLLVTFPRPLRSTAAGTNIVVNVPSYGTGNLTATAAAWGFTA